MIETLTLEQAAELLHVSRWTVLREIRSGDLRAFRAGKRLRITPEALQAYIAEREEKLCRSVATEIAGRSASALAAVSALNELFPPAPRGGTPSTPKPRRGGRRSTLRLVGQGG